MRKRRTLHNQPQSCHRPQHCLYSSTSPPTLLFQRTDLFSPLLSPMSSQQLIASHRENAEVYHGDALCKQKSKELLGKINMPKGLLPLDDLIEVGYNQTTGFVWLTQKKKKDHVFRLIGRKVAYDNEVTAFVDDRRLRRLTGVKSKELLIWISISDICINDPASGKITFGTPTGLSRTFPVSAFEEEEK